MATELAVDDPPAGHVGKAHGAPAMDMTGERYAAVKARGINSVEELCAAEKLSSFSPPRKLGAADGTLADSTSVDVFAAEARQQAEFVTKDTNSHPVEFKNYSQLHDSGDGTMNDQQEIPSQGICSQATQTIVDLTDTDASDSMLLDGLRSMLQKRQERRQKRSVLKEERNKRSRADGGKANEHMNKERATAYSRFSIGYFVKIVDIVCKSNHRMQLVRNNGFGYLLELDDCLVPRPFVQWVADNISTKDEAIVLRGKQIPLNAEAVSLVLGITAGSTKIRTVDEDIGKAEFLSLFGLTELPSISFFGNKLKNENLPDDDYLRCFLTVALATFLCPTSNTKPSTKYLGALVDVSKLKDLDWCSFVHSWSMCYVNKYQTNKQKEKRISTTLGGCIYQLAVRCLDFNKFGSISIPSALPRICFWKGKTIKHFSDMLLAKKGLYEPLQIKDEAETCYAEKDGGWASTAKNSNIRRAIERIVGNSLSDKVKEDIFVKFQDRMKDENLQTCMIAKQVLLDTLHVVSSSFRESQGTVKAESSGHLYMPTDEENASGSTVRVDSDGIEINSDRIVRKKRRKTSTQQSTGSTTGNAVLQNDTKGTTAQVAGTTVNEVATETREPQLLKEQEQQAKIEKNKDIGVSCGSNPEVKMVDVDKKAPESNGKFCNTGEAVPELSSSLNYMLLVAKLACAIDGSEADIKSKVKCPKDAGPSFSGFQDNVVARETFLQSKLEDQPNEKQKTFVLSQVNKNKDQNKHVQMDIDINMPLFENKDIERNGKGIQHNLHPLDIAREKYFFVDDSTPSCRILEDFDDYGNEILEPELRRPLGMDTNTYNAKIEEAKKSGPANTIMQDEQTMQGDLSIHCAQKMPTSTELCKYRDFLPGFKEKDGIIDLTSPVAHMSTTWNKAKTCYSPMREWNNENTKSSTQQYNKIFSTPSILGKRLFTDEYNEDEYNEGHQEQGTEKQPIHVRDDLQLQLSPEVQILGESSFNGSCSNMVNTADKLYNTKLTLGTSSSGKENLPPKRVIYPSRFLCSPYDHNDRGPLMSHEKQLYSSIITLSKVEPHRSSWVVLVDKTSLSLGQLGDSFDTNGRVEAYVFNVYCRMLFRDNHPRQSKRHYFFTTLGDYFLEKWASEEARRSMRKRALISFNGAGKALPLHESDCLFFPSVHDHHWFLFVVDLAARKFLFLDSDYDGDSPFHLEIKDLMIKKFVKTWEESNVRRMGFKHFGVDYPNLPKQTGRDACGIFVLKRMQSWASRNPLLPQFKMKDVADARVRFAVDILFSTHNTIDEGKKLVKNF